MSNEPVRVHYELKPYDNFDLVFIEKRSNNNITEVILNDPDIIILKISPEIKCVTNEL